MAEVRPFHGLRYNTQAIQEPSSVLAPPYDIISPELQEELHRRSPLNVVRLELGKSLPGDNEAENWYARAARLFQEWQTHGVLVRETTPALYLVQEEFQGESGLQRRLVLFGAVRLEAYERGIVLPHEETTRGPKADRLRLMSACQANISPILALYQDPGGLHEILLDQTRRPSEGSAFASGEVNYTMWVLREPALLEHVQRLLRPQRLLLADGHHRYETALAYRDARAQAEPQEGGTKGHHFVLTGLINMEDPGLQILAFHRVLGGLVPEKLGVLRRRIDELFDLEPYPSPEASVQGFAKCLDGLQASATPKPAFGLFDREQGLLSLLTLKPSAQRLLPPTPAPEFGRCEPWLLHHAVLEPVLGASPAETLLYPHDLPEVVRLVTEEPYQLAFLLRPMPIKLFRELVSKGHRLPPKSTYFHPKLATGIVMRSLEGEL